MMRGLRARRSLMAAAAAATAALMARSSARDVEAADGSPLIAGQPNSSVVKTSLNRSGGAAQIALEVTNAAGAAIRGQSVNAQGILGESGTGHGVVGIVS